MLLNKKKVLVTGGAGFIGSHLCDALLAAENDVTVIDNLSTGKKENLHKDVQFIEADVRNFDDVKKASAGANVVVHMATHCVRLSLSDPVTNHEVNSTGTLNVLMAAKQAGVERFVYCSSSEVYGDAAEGILNEESRKLPTTIYGASKLTGEYYTLAFHQTHALPGLVVRPFNTYGPRSHFVGAYGEVIPRFAVRIRSGQQPVIFGDGKQTRDFTYVEDTAQGIIAAAQCDELLGDSINIARGEEVEIGKLAKLCLDLHSKTDLGTKSIESRPGEIHRLGADTSKSKRLLDLKFRDLNTGIKDYLNWLDSLEIDYADLASKMEDKNWSEI